MSYTVKTFDTEAEWLWERFNWITSSDTPILFGLNDDYDSPRSLWLKKREKKVKITKRTKYQEFGHRFEPLIAEDFTAATGIGLTGSHDDGKFRLYCSDQYPIACSVDYFTIGEEFYPTPVSCKTAWHEQAFAWDRSVPRPHQLQAFHEMAVFGGDSAYYAAWLMKPKEGPPVFRFHPTQRDGEVINAIVKRAIEFKRLIDLGVAPAVDASPRTRQALAIQYNEPVEEEIELPLELLPWRNRRENALDEIERLQRIVTTAENTVADFLGNRTSGRFADGHRVTYGATKTGRMLRFR